MSTKRNQIKSNEVQEIVMHLVRSAGWTKTSDIITMSRGLSSLSNH